MGKRRDSSGEKLSRRLVVGASVASPLATLPVRVEPLALDPFEAWTAERELISQALRSVPETDEPAQARLLDRSHQLERLIIETPTEDLAGVRAKADILVWYMEMEQADGLAAMRHIRNYLAGRL